MEKKELVAKDEETGLLSLVEREDILEKKLKIYARLLTDPALAKTMEDMALRHEKRKEGLVSLAFGKEAKKKNEQGRVEMNEEGDDK
jgi:hypothetical protein